MRYAVIYQSKSGNTKQVANEIYASIDSVEKEIVDTDQMRSFPEADVYFVGFGIHDSNCGIDIIDILEQTSSAKCAVFVTCGYVPTKGYKEKLERNIEVWIPDDTEYLGMFVCQGKVEKTRQNIMISKMPDAEEQLKQMFAMGSCHPDAEDFHNASNFAIKIQQKVEKNGEIPIW